MWPQLICVPFLSSAINFVESTLRSSSPVLMLQLPLWLRRRWWLSRWSWSWWCDDPGRPFRLPPICRSPRRSGIQPAEVSFSSSTVRLTVTVTSLSRSTSRPNFSIYLHIVHFFFQLSDLNRNTTKFAVDPPAVAYPLLISYRENPKRYSDHASSYRGLRYVGRWVDIPTLTDIYQPRAPIRG